MMFYDDMSKFKPITNDAGLHVHLHDEQAAPGDEVSGRLERLERAVAIMVRQEGASEGHTIAPEGPRGTYDDPR